jgi:biopolymer transport protein ExbB
MDVRHWWWSFMATLILLVSAGPGRCFAQEQSSAPPGTQAQAEETVVDTEPASPGTPAPEKASARGGNETEGNVQVRPSLLRWIYEAEGIFFWPQLALSVVIAAMVVLYALQVRRDNFVPQDFLRDFEEKLRAKKYQEAYHLAKAGTSYLERVLATGLERLSLGYASAEESMRAVAAEEDMTYEHRLNYLSMLANVATLIGLLGTVWGMVGGFREIGAGLATPRPQELANNVAQALITTIWGLLQAIPAIVAYTILRNRFARLALEVENERLRLMSRFVGLGRKGAEGTPAEAAGGEPA